MNLNRYLKIGLLHIFICIFTATSYAQMVGTPYIVPIELIGLDFDGTNDVVSLGNITSLNNTSQYTIEYWGRFANYGTWTTMISKRITDIERVAHIQFGSSSGDVYAFIGSNYIRTTTTINTNEWTHIAVVFDGTLAAIDRLKIFFNGIRQPVVNVGTIPTTTTSSNAIFVIGSEYNFTTPVTSSNTGFLHCEQTMAELRIWSTARSQSQIQSEIYNFNLSPSTIGLLYYYKMDDGAPNGNNSSVTSIVDYKIGNNGTLFNFNLLGDLSNFINLPL